MGVTFFVIQLDDNQPSARPPCHYSADSRLLDCDGVASRCLFTDAEQHNIIEH